MQKLRQWIQSYVGVLSLERRAKERHTEILAHVANMCKSVDELAIERHAEVTKALTILGDFMRGSHAGNKVMLDRIEKMMIAGHIQEPRQFTPPVLDWDTVQAIALHDLEKGP